tara:strand:+ start:468 stop:1037 length:570 start_codon:yes stop_codon:yes gene_type:complete
MDSVKKIENKLKEFLASENDNSRLPSVLKTIEKCKITGWEKWLQIEMAHFLENSFADDIGYRWSREYGYQINHDEKNEEKITTIYPDFAISFDSEESLYLVELKVSDNPSTLDSEIQKDREKYELLKKKDNTLLWGRKRYAVKGVFYIGLLSNNSRNKNNFDNLPRETKFGSILSTNSSYMLLYSGHTL